MILLPSLIMLISVLVALSDDNRIHRVIALVVFLLAMLINIAILTHALTLTSACEVDLIYGGKCVLQAVLIYN